jgi:hypothetical protein
MKCSRHYTFSVLPKSKEITISFLSTFIGVTISEYSETIKHEQFKCTLSSSNSVDDFLLSTWGLIDSSVGSVPTKAQEIAARFTFNPNQQSKVGHEDSHPLDQDKVSFIYYVLLLIHSFIHSCIHLFLHS